MYIRYEGLKRVLYKYGIIIIIKLTTNKQTDTGYYIIYNEMNS